MFYDSGAERTARVGHPAEIQQELTVVVSHGGNTLGRSGQDQAADPAKLGCLSAMPGLARTPPRTRQAPCHGASGRGGCPCLSWIAGTRSSRSLLRCGMAVPATKLRVITGTATTPVSYAGRSMTVVIRRQAEASLRLIRTASSLSLELSVQQSDAPSELPHFRSVGSLGASH